LPSVTFTGIIAHVHRNPRSRSTEKGGHVHRNTQQQPPADEVLEFYSLYLHLLDWAGYKAAAPANGTAHTTCHSMPYWKGKKCYLVGKKAKDHQASAPLPPVGSPASAQPRPQPLAGLNVRDSAHGKVIGLLPQGTEIQVQEPATNRWAQITSIVSGAPVGTIAGTPPDPQAAHGWVYLPSLNGPDVVPDTMDAVVLLNDAPWPVKAGDRVGYLGGYQQYKNAQKKDQPSPIPSLVHVEVLAGPTFPGFLAKSRARDGELTTGKDLLVVHKGAKLVQSTKSDSTVQAGLILKLTSDDAGSGWWAKVQPHNPPPAQPQQPHSGHPHGSQHHPAPTLGAAVGSPVWVMRSAIGPGNTPITAATPAWTKFPLQLSSASTPQVGFDEVFSRAQLEQASASMAAEKNGTTVTRWWKITVGDADSEQSATGWVCEKNHPQTQWQSPWAWPGFETVDAASILPDALYGRLIKVLGMEMEGEDFNAYKITAEAGMLISRIENAVSIHGGEKAGTVTARDLKLAMQVPWLAQALSRLIVRYESEWGGGMGKWDAMDPLMGSQPLKDRWKAEKQRIQKLQWWDQVKSVTGFPADPKVWHFHPVGLVGNFLVSSGFDIEKFIAIYKTKHVAYFRWYDDHQHAMINAPALNQQSENNLRTLLNWINDLYIKNNSEFSIKYIAYMLATARVESYSFWTNPPIFFGPVTEHRPANDIWNAAHTHVVVEGCNSLYRNRLGNTAPEDGYTYRGRGLTQITGKTNYENFSPVVGQDLVSNPDAALTWPNAAKIMVTGMLRGMFSGRSLPDYLGGNKHDYVGARYIINGTNKAKIIAEYAEKFEEIAKECT